MDGLILNQNQQANGDHEVHNKSSGCSFMPMQASQIDLGQHPYMPRSRNTRKMAAPKLEN